jgi:hypothetical protein
MDSESSSDEEDSAYVTPRNVHLLPTDNLLPNYSDENDGLESLLIMHRATRACHPFPSNPQRPRHSCDRRFNSPTSSSSCSSSIQHTHCYLFHSPSFKVRSDSGGLCGSRREWDVDPPTPKRRRAVKKSEKGGGNGKGPNKMNAGSGVGSGSNPQQEHGLSAPAPLPPNNDTNLAIAPLVPRAYLLLLSPPIGLAPSLGFLPTAFVHSWLIIQRLLDHNSLSWCLLSYIQIYNEF